MKRQLPLAFALAAAVAQAAMFAWSNLSATVTRTGLRVAFTETGLTAGATAHYAATSDVAANFVCVNRGGNTPSAANKRTAWNGTVHGSATLTANASGSVTGGVNIRVPTPSGFGCPRGQDPRLSSATFTNVQLTDTTNNASTGVSGTFTKILIPPK